MDYLTLLKPLPTECRDTVTGNAFFHGCVEELTWFLEARSGWLAGLALGLCMIHVSSYMRLSPLMQSNLLTFHVLIFQVVQAVLSLILIQAIKKEEQLMTFKR
jgi:hypothetical protein